MSINVTINGAPVLVKEATIKYRESTNGRGTLMLTVRDDAGANHYQSGMPITFTDTVNNISFSGFIHDSKENLLYPNTTIEHDISATDGNTLPGNLFYTGPEYQNRYAGDIAVDLLNKYLANEGVTAAYAARNDQTINQWSQGVLTNTVSANNNGGDLELAPSGVDFLHTESASGPTPFNCLKFTGYCPAGFTTAISWRQIWSGSMTVVSGDDLGYDIWISSSSPAIVGGLDMTFSDGSIFSAFQGNGAGNDGEGLGPYPLNDLSGFANDTWYSRGHGVGSPVTGKTLTGIYIALAGNTEGTYTIYLRRIRWYNGSTTKINVFSDTSTSTSINVQSANTGFLNTSLSVVQAVNQTTINTFTENLSTVKLLKGSALSWYTTTTPANTTLQNPSTILLESSLDNKCWQTVTNGSAIPQLVPGMDVSAQTLYLRATFTQGQYADAWESLGNLYVAVYTSYASSKTDITQLYNTANWASGTGTNTTVSAGNLTISGVSIPYSSTSDYVGQTTAYGNNFSSVFLYKRSLAFQAGGTASESCFQKIANANSWQNFIAEIDVVIPQNAGDYVGLAYRTTGWGAGFGCFAYFAGISNAGPALMRGGNTSSGSTVTTLNSPSMSLSAGSTHRLKIVVSGNLHSVYVDNILMINSLSDSTFPNTGNFGLGYFTGSGTTTGQTTYFSNLGITSSLSATWVSPSISLSGPGTYGSSLILWDTQHSPQTATIGINVSYDGGVTYTACTNGSPLPTLTAGQSLTSVAAKLQIVLSSSNASGGFPALAGVQLVVMGQFNATGTRVSPALSLAPVGRAGNTLVSWSAIQPPNTTIGVDTSLDAFTFSLAGSGAVGTNIIAGINSRPTPVIDGFGVNTALQYTTTCRPGGTKAGSWNYNLTNSRLVGTAASSGGGAMFLYNFYTGKDTTTWADLDTADGAGLCINYDGNNFYVLKIYDASASTTPNTAALLKYSSGSFTSIASTSIVFTRGTPHRFILQFLGNVLTASIDGVPLASPYTDASPLGAGRAGLYLDNNTANFYQLRIDGYGDDVTSMQVFSRVRLSSTDPTATPQVYDLSVSTHSNSIQNGVLIPQSSYSVLNGNKNTIGQIYDDLAKQSNFWWRIIAGQLYFQALQSTPSPWICTPADPLIAGLLIENGNDAYKNSYWVANGTDTLARVESFVGDDTTTSFNTAYPIDSITSILLNNVSQKVGIKGADTGKDWYYTRGQNAIPQDANALAPLNQSQILTVTYNAQISITTNVKHDAEITKRAARSGTSGLVEDAQDADPGATKASMIVLADGILTQYGVDGKTATFTTLRPGLRAGQILTIFLAPFAISDGWFLITELNVSYRQIRDATGTASIQAVFDLKAIQGPVVGDWTRFISSLRG